MSNDIVDNMMNMDFAEIHSHVEDVKIQKLSYEIFQEYDHDVDSVTVGQMKVFFESNGIECTDEKIMAVIVCMTKFQNES